MCVVRQTKVFFPNNNLAVELIIAIAKYLSSSFVFLESHRFNWYRLTIRARWCLFFFPSSSALTRFCEHKDFLLCGPYNHRIMPNMIQVMYDVVCLRKKITQEQ